MNEISPWRMRRLARAENVQPEFYASEPDEISLSAYWDILVKRRNIILPIFLVVFAAGGYFALSATTLYTAAATIKIEPQNPQVTGGIGELQSLESRGEYDYHQTQFALLRSRPVSARVITELGLESNKTFTDAAIVSPNPVSHVKSWMFRILRVFTSLVAPLLKSAPPTDNSQALNSVANLGKGGLELTVAPWLIDQYLGFINIAPVKNTRLARVEFTTPDPSLSQALANAHLQTFMRMSLESRFGLTQEAREFLDQKKNELRQKLEKSEAELNTFRRGHNVLSVEKGENIVVDRLVDLNKQLTTARGQRIDAESLYRTVENRNYQDLAEIMRQGLVQQLKSSIATLEAEKARTATVFKPDHPRIQELNQQIAAARQAFNNEVANVVRGIKSTYAAAIAKERALESEAGKQQEDALKLKELGVQYTVLQQEVNANRSLYESVLKRLSETNVSNDLAISNMQIVERAAKPLRPSGPDVPLFLIASMVSGLFLGVGAAFLREFVDSTVGTPEDVWRSVGLGTLGVVPNLKLLEHRKYGGQIEHAAGRQQDTPLSTKSGPAAGELIISHSPLSMISECYRTIRTSLLLSQAEKPPQLILVTSPSPGEGKTVTSLNLAIALAQDGHSVLLVDGDMRKGRCHNRLGLRNNRGLSNVLTGGLSLEEGIQQTPVSGLSLLSRGVLPPNPSELLGSRKMKEVLKELRQSFDFILIDSPPVIAISDAAILSVVVDGVLLVLHGEKTSTAYAQKAVERLDMIRARLLGVILNGVNLANPQYSFYRSYSSYYELPNGNGSADAPDGASSKEPDEDVGRLSKILGVKATKDLDNNGAQKTESDRSPREMTRSDPVTGSGDIERAVKVEPRSTVATDSLDKPVMKRTKPVSPVSRQFINQLIDAFMESVGPMAPLIVRDRIALLGESQDAFPKSRIDELVKLIAPEIFHTELRIRFQKRISEELNNLENT